MKNKWINRHFSSNTNFYIFIGILVLALLYRLWGITNPLTDSQQFRQTYTALFARNFFLGDMNIFNPSIGVLNYSNISEFQLYTWLIAILYQIFGMHEIIGRFISIGFGLGSIGFMYLLIKRFFTERAGLIGSGLLAVLPMMAYFSRTFMLESMMIFLVIVSIYLLGKWTDTQHWKYFFLSIITASMALLIKIPSIYMLAPLGFILFNRKGLRAITDWQTYVYFISILILPFMWYYIYPRYMDAGIIDSRVANAYVSGAILEVNAKLLVKSSVWAKLIFSRIGEYHLGIVGFLFLIVAIILRSIGFGKSIRKVYHNARERQKKGESILALKGFYSDSFFEEGQLKDRYGNNRAQLVFYFWLLGVLVFIFGFVAPNLAHAYYQLPIIPPAIALVAGYVDMIIKKFEDHKTRLWKTLLIIHIALLMVLLPFSFLKVKSRLEVAPLYLNFSKHLKEKVSKKDLIVYFDTMPRTEVFYYSNRKGYMLIAPVITMNGIPLMQDVHIPETLNRINACKALGARYLATPYMELKYLKIKKILDGKYVNLLENIENRDPDGNAYADARLTYAGMIYDLGTSELTEEEKSNILNSKGQNKCLSIGWEN